ncbi:sensor histidine kinase [Fodinibius halophilus]|uniref:histidine kinase n=1 Tax=Fodinibius halophilus TaxID=1736908 RepID=A0A6M1T369_9BACT|nr:histidine kinase dimerization/phosphoacceptor domain -containing protein [Fodinibius halophilus]NGP88517.1 hypothetical protein [Fodinibius halophilus]
MGNQLGTEDSTSQRGHWRPLPWGYLLERYGLFSKRAGLLFLGWILLFAISFLSVIYWIPNDWSSLTTSRKAISLFLLFYPPLMICNFLLFWLGFEWGFIPAYLSTFMLALASDMPVQWAILFGIAVVLGMAIFSLVYYSTRFRYTLRSLSDLAFFVGVALVASMASSLGSLIWSHVQALTIEQTLIAWQSWWTGAFLQIVFINAPILFLVGNRAEKLKDAFFEVPERPDVSLGWVYTSIITVVTVLGVFILSAEKLGALRIQEALRTTESSLGSEIISATQTFEMTAWISITILLAAGLAGIRLVESWNKTLKEQIRIKRALIAEIHDRVKNNMQLVSGLLELQMHNTQNVFVERELRKSHSRIYSMGKVHEQTYQHEEAADVKIDVYVNSLVKQVEVNFGDDQNINFELNCVPIKLTINQAVTFGLLLNEILTFICRQKKSLKDQSRVVTIGIQEVGDVIRTKFEGIVAPFDFDHPDDELDVTLINKLSRQLNTTLSKEQNSEKEITLEFSFEKKPTSSFMETWIPKKAIVNS